MARKKQNNKKGESLENMTSQAPSSMTTSSQMIDSPSSSSDDDNRPIDNNPRESTTEQSLQITSVTSQDVISSTNLQQSSHRDSTEREVEIDYDPLEESDAEDESIHRQASETSQEVVGMTPQQGSTRKSTANLSNNREKQLSPTTTSPSKKKSKIDSSPPSEGRSRRSTAIPDQRSRQNKNQQSSTSSTLARSSSAVGAIDNTSSSQVATGQRRRTAETAVTKPRHQTERLIQSRTISKVHNPSNTRVETEEEEERWYGNRHDLLSDETVAVPLDTLEEEYEEALGEFPYINKEKIRFFYNDPKRHHYDDPEGMCIMMATTPAEMEKLSVAEAAALQYYNEMQEYPSADMVKAFILEMIIERRRLQALDTTLFLHPHARGRYPKTLYRYEQKLDKEFPSESDPERKDESDDDSDYEKEQRPSRRPTVEKLATKMAAQQRLVQTLQSRSTTMAQAATTSDALPSIRRKSKQGGDSFLHTTEATNSSEGEEGEIRPSTRRNRQQRETVQAQQAAQLAQPIQRTAQAVGTTIWSQPNQPTAPQSIIPPARMEWNVTPRTATAASVSTQPSASPAQHSMSTGPLQSPSRIDPPPLHQQSHQVVIVPTDTLDSFTLDLQAQSRSLTVEDVVK